MCAFVAFGGGLAPALGSEGPREREWFTTFYWGQFITSNLGDVPRNAFTGDLQFEDAYFVSGALSYVAVPDIQVDIPFARRVLNGSSLEIEGQAGRHFGRQDHGEFSLSVLWRSPDIGLPGGGNVNFAFGEGLSWATSKPKVEGVITGEEPRQFLNYLALEAELSHEAAPGIAVVPRIHHRSGIFGVIAPQGSGSNFVGVGLRFDLR